MKKNKNMKKMQETLSSIDSVLAALDTYPNLEDALLERAQSELNKYLGQLFPTQLDFSKEILEHLVGTDVLIEIISNFLTSYLPAVEVGVKAALLANMQNLGTNCTIDPFIYEKAIKEGILFDLRQIDLYDKLTVSPLDKKIGQYYYFGIDDCESSYDVLQSAIDPNNQSEESKQKNGVNQKTSYLNRAINDSVGHYFGGRKRDFDCLLWYMKNKGVTRQVWGKRTFENESIFCGDGNVEAWVNKKGQEDTIYYEIDGGKLTFYKKDNSPYGGGEAIPMSTEKSYYYKCGTKGVSYLWTYGHPSICKLSRKHFYYYEIEHQKYQVFLYDKNKDKWEGKNVTVSETYESIEKLPAEQKENDYVVIDNKLCLLKSDVKVKDGVVVSAKTEGGIDVTNSIKIELFVDYKEKEDNKTKGDIIKDGRIPSSTFGDVNTPQKRWKKDRINKNEVLPENCEFIEDKNIDCYYIDNDGDKSYTPNVDKIAIPPFDKDGEYLNVNNSKAKDNKYTKDFGVITLEYSPRTGNILQSDGNPMKQQTPYDNVLHVFFGNVKELSQTRDNAERILVDSSEKNKVAQKLMKKFILLQETHQKAFKQKLKEWKRIDLVGTEKYTYLSMFQKGEEFYNIILSGVKDKTPLMYNSIPSNLEVTIEDLNKKVEEIKKEVEFYETKIYSALLNSNNKDENYFDSNKNGRQDFNEWGEFNYSEFLDFRKKVYDLLKFDDGNYYTITAIANKVADFMAADENYFYLKARDVSYPEPEKNYYLKRTLFEFNADYINSLQLFDSKVLAAQLITSLFGGLTMSAVIGATASWKTELIRDVVKDIVKKQIAAEDYTVSDCFFTFTNDAYNGMLRAADLRQAGLYSQHGEENGNSTIDPIKMLEGLNEINKCSDQAGQTSVIKGVITEASAEVCKDEIKENEYLAINTNFGIQMSFIETLMINLCTQLVMAVLSPKVYLMILINLEMFGLTTNYDLKSFIQNFNALIRSIVKSIVDQFMEYMINCIGTILYGGDINDIHFEGIIPKLISKLAFEQVEMYARLIKQILMHLRMLTSCGGNGIGWTQDNVEYADITSSESTIEPIDKC